MTVPAEPTDGREGRHHRERSAQIVESATDAIISKDRDGRITGWNLGAERLYGYRVEEVLAKPISLLIPQELQAQEWLLLQRVLTGERIEHYETKRLRKDGNTIDVSLTLFELRDDAGEIVGAASIARDISDRKSAEQEVETARDQALETSRQKSMFVANMSHELRTPLNGVIGMAGLLRDSDLDPVQSEYVDALARSGEVLLGVVNDVLDFSKIVAGHLELDPTDFDLRCAVEEARLMLTEEAQGKGLKVSHWVDADVPVAVNGDRARLRQVLLNLLSNAVKFTVAGEVGLRVRRCRGDRIHFAISDTGVGIDKQQAPRLFEAFVQADTSTTRQYGGTGLGLAISTHLVERMGGEIGAEPREGGGSVFWFTAELPAVIERSEVSRLGPVIRSP